MALSATGSSGVGGNLSGIGNSSYASGGINVPQNYTFNALSPPQNGTIAVLGAPQVQGASTTTAPSTSLSGTTIIPGVNDAATIASYDQAIAQYQQALGQLPTQLQGSQNQINSAYQTAYNQLLGAKNQATQGYQTSTTGNQQGYVTNKNTVGANAGQSLNGLERLLGSRGAGGSSAALFAAPQAVAQQATQQRSAAGQTFGQNQAGLDTSYNNYLTSNANDLSGIGSQRDQNLNQAQQQIAQTQAGLLQQLATLSAQKAAAQGTNPTSAAAPFLSSAQNYLTQAGQLGLKTFTPQYNTSAYQAPQAASYAVNPFAVPTAGNPSQGILSNSIAPALATLLKPKASGVTTT